MDARPVARCLWVALHVVDDAKPIPQRVDELPVDVVASASVDPWSRLARVDQHPQTSRHESSPKSSSPARSQARATRSSSR